MLFRRVCALGLLAALGLGTAACTEGGYGYSGMSLGYGTPAYYGGGYASSSYGWYGDYYYPGSGYYVYDRDRRPHRWNDGQRRYWEARRDAWRGGDRRQPRENWAGYRRGDHGSYNRGEGTRPAYRGDRQRDRSDYRRDYSRSRGEPRGDSRRGRRN